MKKNIWHEDGTTVVVDNKPLTASESVKIFEWAERQGVDDNDCFLYINACSALGALMSEKDSDMCLFIGDERFKDLKRSLIKFIRKCELYFTEKRKVLD